MTPQLLAFVQRVAQMAAALPGKPPVLLVVRDPVDRIVNFVGTAGALDNMRVEIREKAGVEEVPVGETSWE